MSKKKTIDTINEARLAEMKEAKNAINGYKTGVSAGTAGVGDNRKR